MGLKLYSNKFSTCGQRVVMVLLEKQVPFELIELDFGKGEHKAPEYLQKQPFGQLPCIDDDGFILYESRAICRYICAKYPDQGTPLVPTGLQAIALYEQASSVEVSNFDPHVSAAVGEAIFKSMTGGGPKDDKVFDAHILKLSATLDVYDAILAKQKYIAGNEISLADLVHIPYAAMLPAAGSEIMQSKPNVARWWNEITSRSTWKEVQGL